LIYVTDSIEKGETSGLKFIRYANHADREENMIRKIHFIGSLIIFMVYLGLLFSQPAYSQNSAGNKTPANQAPQATQSTKPTTPASQPLAPAGVPGEYYLTLEKIGLVNNRIHVVLKNTGKEKVPAQAYTAGKLTLKSNSFDKKWTLSEVDPGQALNKATKSVDFDTQLTLTAPETVRVFLENLKGDRNKQAKLTPALLPIQTGKGSGSKPMPISPPPPAHIGSESLIPAGVHSEGIVITSPRMGDRYLPGSTLVVRFNVRPNVATYGAVPSSFRIILYEETRTGLSHRIYEGPLNEFSYVIPADMAQSDKYKVYVAGIDNLHYYCTTGHFSIQRLSINDAVGTPPGRIEQAPYLYVSGPEAYATWNKGCSYTVSWRSNVAPSNTAILLVDAGTGNEYAIAHPRTVTTVSEGSFSASFWVPTGPDVPPSGTYFSYRVKVALDNAGSPLSGQGEALKIQESSITVDDPAGEYTACRGRAINIIWSYAGCRGRTYRIILLTDLPLGVAPVIINPSVAFLPSRDVGGYLFQQTYSWTVPIDLREGTYRIKVETNPVSFAEQPVSGTGRQFMINDCD
jgi:hypothetical protein